jgi:hypothetical protein
VDLARDLIDHRIADLHDEDAGMVDDMWITWTHDAATLGPIITGTAALLHQLGRAGVALSAIAAHIGWSHANVWREIPWTDVRRIERPQVKLLLPRAQLPELPHRTSHATTEHTGAMLYSELINLPVFTRDHRRLGIIDIRTAALISEPPQVLGLLVAAHSRRRSFGLKHFDTTTIRLGSITRGGCFLAWSDIARITDQAIHTNAASGELTPLAAAPSPEPPPMPEGPTPP